MGSIPRGAAKEYCKAILSGIERAEGRQVIRRSRTIDECEQAQHSALPWTRAPQRESRFPVGLPKNIAKQS
ncbi:MAG: hypothetical protein A3H72_01385 [Candidatus Doudnabacteria bacterium RIFCSPLOWO2_02_FULL_48_8]|nr:MAG: hypothetical protein A3H72_01385 [Candidatus Doudnabacteria bacterium RIFCSPLOWO2_02_FULL_48_8]